MESLSTEAALSKHLMNIIIFVIIIILTAVL